jgi:Protein of unknown function (DUF3007)
MASEEGTTERSKKSTTGTSLPFWLDIGTKGGAIVWSLVLFIVPIIGYNVVTGIFGVDEIEAGKWIGVGFTAVALLAWGSTYLFRVATKDMTYVSCVGTTMEVEGSTARGLFVLTPLVLFTFYTMQTHTFQSSSRHDRPNNSRTTKML